MKTSKKKETCNDKHCPFHSGFVTHGRILVGKVIKLNSTKTAQIELSKLEYLPKYERYEKKRIRLPVHYSPCIKLKLGDKVRVIECRPISKSKNFVVIKNESIKS